MLDSMVAKDGYDHGGSSISDQRCSTRAQKAGTRRIKRSASSFFCSKEIWIELEARVGESAGRLSSGDVLH